MALAAVAAANNPEQMTPPCTQGSMQCRSCTDDCPQLSKLTRLPMRFQQCLQINAAPMTAPRANDGQARLMLWYL